MIALSKSNFTEEVLESKGLVIVDFWGEGCVPCQALMPDFESLESQYNQVKFAKLNTTAERKLALSQRVLGLPTIVLYKNGERMGECTKNTASLEGIKALIESQL